jgi:hypothetical protein
MGNGEGYREPGGDETNLTHHTTSIPEGELDNYQQAAELVEGAKVRVGPDLTVSDGHVEITVTTDGDSGSFYHTLQEVRSQNQQA